MNPLSLILRGLGLLGRLVGVKPGPDVKPLQRRVWACPACWRYDLVAREHLAGEVCPHAERERDWS